MFLLLLGLTSAKSRPHVQLIRAEHPSNGSSEPLSESLSKLSSHQIPRCLRVPLQLKGCTRTSSLFSPTTPSGASVLCACSLHSALHFDLGVELACSAAARVPPRRPSLGIPFWLRLAVLVFLMYEAYTSCRGCAASGPTLAWVRSPFFIGYSTSCVSVRLFARSMGSGADGRAFPSAVDFVYCHRMSSTSSLCLVFRGVPVHRGGRTCFPTATRVHLHEVHFSVAPSLFLSACSRISHAIAH